MSHFKNNKNLITFLLIFIIGLFLYFYKLEIIPNGFYIDESLPGYNAYSLLKTGKDEYGKVAPIVFRFYGSYNPPLFTYLVVPSIIVFGLNVFAVRAVSSFFGLLVFIPIYFLLKESAEVKGSFTSFVGAFLYLISPWALMQSRVGYEVSLGLFLFSLGVFFAWRTFKKPKNLFYSLFFLSLSTYAAYSQRFIVPIFLFGYFILFKDKLISKISRTIINKSAFFALIIQVPHLLIITTPAFFPKHNLTSIDIVASQAQKMAKFLPNFVSFFLAFGREFLSQYVTYFSPESLFFLPDSDLQRSIPELSVFYFWMVVPYLVGLYILLKRKSSFSKFVFLLALVSPIPAALTKDPFSTHRAFPLVLPMILIMSLGIDELSLRLQKFFKIGLAVVLLVSALLLWRSYFVLLPNERAKYWGYGYEELAKKVVENPDLNFVIDQNRIKPSYSQLAFFTKYEPVKFQKEIDLRIKESYYENIKFTAFYKFGNIETRNIVWEEDVYRKQVLVGDEYAISEDQANEHCLKEFFEIKSPIDEIIFRGYITNPDRKCRQDPDNIHCR